MKMKNEIGACLVLCVVGCGSAASDTGSDQAAVGSTREEADAEQSTGEQAPEKPSSEAVGEASSEGFEPSAELVGDAWVFQHDLDEGFTPLDGLLTGPPAVSEDGCLTIQGYIVMWRPSSMQSAAEIIEQLSNGSTADVEVSGGVHRRVPVTVSEHCPSAEDVWLN